MTKSQILQVEINNAFEKIKLLSDKEKLKVHDIFLDIYKKYVNLTKEDFISDFYFETYKKSKIISRPHFERELKSLLENSDDDTNINNNFFQIKASILMMSPEKFTK